MITQRFFGADRRIAITIIIDTIYLAMVMSIPIRIIVVDER